MVPAFKCKVNTKDYLLKVKAGTYWVPMYPNVRIASCYRKPTREAAMKEMLEVLYKFNYDIGFVDATLVDLDWILKVMSTLAPTHQYFNKGWSPNKKSKKPVFHFGSNRAEAESDEYLFFDGLDFKPRGKRQMKFSEQAD
jgi:hypothetical protein